MWNPSPVNSVTKLQTAFAESNNFVRFSSKSRGQRVCVFTSGEPSFPRPGLRPPGGRPPGQWDVSLAAGALSLILDCVCVCVCVYVYTQLTAEQPHHQRCYGSQMNCRK